MSSEDGLDLHSSEENGQRVEAEPDGRVSIVVEQGSVKKRFQI